MSHNVYDYVEDCTDYNSVVAIQEKTLSPVFNNGLKPPCLAERPLSHLLSRVAEPTGLSC